MASDSNAFWSFPPRLDNVDLHLTVNLSGASEGGVSFNSTPDNLPTAFISHQPSILTAPLVNITNANYIFKAHKGTVFKVRRTQNGDILPPRPTPRRFFAATPTPTTTPGLTPTPTKTPTQTPTRTPTPTLTPTITPGTPTPTPTLTPGTPTPTPTKTLLPIPASTPLPPQPPKSQPVSSMIWRIAT